MMNSLSKMLGNLHHVTLTMVLKSIFIGAFSAVFVILFRIVYMKAEALNRELLHQQSLGPLIAFFALFVLISILIGALVRWEPLSSGSGIPQVQAEVLGRLEMHPAKVLLAKFVGGAASAFSGLSLGRQGPCIQICAAVGKIIARITRCSHSETRILITAGASAGLAAAFNAPISGALFALEDVHKKFSHIVMLPAFIAAITADSLAKYIFGMDPVFVFAVPHQLPLHAYITLLPLGLITGMVAVCLNKSLLGAHKLFQRIPIPKIFLPTIAIILSFFICIFFPALQNGGESLIENITQHGTPLLILLALIVGKIIFTSLSFASTSQGGIFIPTLVVGALTGALYYDILLHFKLIAPSLLPNFALFGMVGVLTGVIQSPIVSILLVTEMSGSFTTILGPIIVAVISILVANSLFHTKPIYEVLLERLLAHQVRPESDEPKVLTEFIVGNLSKFSHKKLKDINWPHDSLVVSIHGATADFVPNGQSTIMPGDKLIILVNKNKLFDLDLWLESNDEEDL